MSNTSTQPVPPAGPAHNAEPSAFFFFNGKRIVPPMPTLTGAAIKALIRAQGFTFEPNDSLLLEGNGPDAADRIIGDDESVDLTVGHGSGPKHFIAKPPTNFGTEVAAVQSIAEEHFVRLREAYPAASMTPISADSYLVHVPGVLLPAGWSKTVTNIWFVVPAGYPGSKPDCFWSDEDLRLAGGREPQSSNLSPVPHLSTGARWYSWHAGRWSATMHDLRTYMAIIRNRFEQKS